ncbi:hypothetical protein FQN54_008216 [Arachnomyces sp. PD_36]|nr:hypothetical protein FQN54_008216 [Arachnomyces sp. PD_36]
MAVERLEFDINGLYVLLFDLGDGYRFHWQLFFAKSLDSGTVFHLTNPDTNPKAWVYETMESGVVVTSKDFLVGLKVAMMDLDLYEALEDRLRQIPIGYSTRFKEEITCRVWLKEALFGLDNEGYISLTNSVETIENEAKTAAMMNRYKQKRSIVRS